MNDLTVKNVDLFGDTVVAAQDKDGVIWAGISWICNGIGLNKDQIGYERKKIQGDLVLSQGGKILPPGDRQRKFRRFMPTARLCSFVACKNLYNAKYEREQSRIG